MKLLLLHFSCVAGRMGGEGGGAILTDRWTREWTDKWRVRGAVLAGTEGASAGEFEEQPWRLRLTVSPDDGGQPRGAAGAPAGRGAQMFPHLIG